MSAKISTFYIIFLYTTNSDNIGVLLPWRKEIKKCETDDDDDVCLTNWVPIIILYHLIIWRLISEKRDSSTLILLETFHEPLFFNIFIFVCIHFHLKIFQIPFPFFLFKFFGILYAYIVNTHTHSDTLEHFCLSTMGNSKDLHTWRWRERVYFCNFLGEREIFVCRYISFIWSSLFHTPFNVWN